MVLNLLRLCNWMLITKRAFNVCISEEAKQEYIKLIDNNSLYKRNVQISPNDHLVILTTCTSDMTNGRNVLVGKITNKTYPEKNKKEQRNWN